LVEPLEEFGAALDLVTRQLGGTRVSAAAGSTAGSRTFHVHRDLVGSSLLREREGEGVDGTPRQVDVIALDGLIRANALEPPFLIKIDVQGAEADVLAGARIALQEAVAVVIEVSFFSFFIDGSRFDEIVATMRAAGFVVFDIENLARRPLDGALAQADLIFVKEDSPVRRDHRYASPAQRAAQDTEFAETMRRRLERVSGR
jgi:FkbM family methyltransferase